MNKKEIIKSSFRIMKRNKMRTFFMVLGIVISIASLILTITMGRGFQQQISERAKKYLGSNSIVVMAQKMKLDRKQVETDLISTLTIEDLKAIAAEVPSISLYDPVQVAGNREVVSGSRNISTSIKGSSCNGAIVWNRGVSSGEYFTEEEEITASRVALIGPGIAAALFGNADPVGAQIRISNIPFTVKGVLVPKGVDPHGNDLDLDIVVPITTLMKRMLNVDYLSLGKFILNDETQMEEAVKGITAVLKERHQITEDSNADFMVITPTFVKEKISEMTRIFNVFLPLISLIALLAAGIVIVVLMLMSVNERIGEIGLRKAVGARSKDVLFQFVAEVSITSMFGGIVGMAIGLACFALVSIKMQVPFSLSVLLLICGFALPVMVGIIAGIIPAQKAAKYNPVDALKQ
jgi:putative ABC transport system permease protein